MGLQEELIAALDADRVTTGADELRRHGTDEGWHPPAAPDFVVYPRDTAEAARIEGPSRDPDRVRFSPPRARQSAALAAPGP